ncbi:uncharacterized protein LOC124405395 [Diprion similis]|uniref:uncharacterized protein LOC124405395 n=1 Tax=Diprion similis TaxID=362088 RepID=UPI001EF9A99A|nr:uncharacterized protein LOC124405395 [Diprion similis]
MQRQRSIGKMDVLWLIGFFLGIEFLCGRTTLAHISVLSSPKDAIGYGTQYRFQYYVRDEHGDYKTQEEAGEGGSARGSYAVEEPNGELRIVQYTTDLSGGFKAHIKVDHAGKSPSKLQEIDIPAEELRKLMTENRRKKAELDIPEVKSSKSYVLGPPRKMSDIVMEQAAAIREIISKEIKAEEEREAVGKLKVKGGENPVEEDLGSTDVVDCDEEKTATKIPETSLPRISSLQVEDKTKPTTEPTIPPTRRENEETQEQSVDEVDSPDEVCGSGGCPSYSSEKTAKAVSTEEQTDERNNSQVARDNSEVPEIGKETATLQEGDLQSPLVHVALTSRKIDENPSLIREAKPSPVKNFSFKNRMMFYKPADTSPNGSLDPNLPRKSDGVEKSVNIAGDLANENHASTEGEEEIVLYSPQVENGEQGNRKRRFIKVPYEVLRPYFASVQEEEQKKMTK